MNEEERLLEIMRIEKLKEEASKQYVAETEKEIPSIDHSVVTITNNTEIVVLRDKDGRFVANYQVQADNKFFRMDTEE